MTGILTVTLQRTNAYLLNATATAAAAAIAVMRAESRLSPRCVLDVRVGVKTRSWRFTKAINLGLRKWTRTAHDEKEDAFFQLKGRFV